MDGLGERIAHLAEVMQKASLRRGDVLVFRSGDPACRTEEGAATLRAVAMSLAVQLGFGVPLLHVLPDEELHALPEAQARQLYETLRLHFKGT